MTGFRIRKTTPRDHDDVARGFASAMGRPEDAVRREVVHDLDENPFGSSSMVAVASTGEVVGHLGATHIPMSIKGRDKTFGRFCACWLDPAYRIGGIHGVLPGLHRNLLESLDPDNGPQALVGCWSEPDWWYLRQNLGFEVMSTSIEFRRDPAPFEFPDGIEIIQLDEGLLEGWKTGLNLGKCSLSRTGAYVSWLDADPNTTTWCIHKGGRITGLAMVQDTEEQRLVVDWAIEGDDEDSSRSLMGAVLQCEQTVVMPIWTARTGTVHFLQRCGFFARAGTESYVTVQLISPGLNQLWLSEHWEITGATVGCEPMPTMTIEEDIVTPPPAGTPSGRDRHGN